MKKIIFTVFLLILFTSCSNYVLQLFDTTSTNTISTTIKDHYSIFENDTVKITYSFWANKGVLQFAVYNKLDKPIYIDWKNSAYILNDNKYNYWNEETQVDLPFNYKSLIYTGPLLKAGIDNNPDIHYTSPTTIKPERVTFIPPKSNYYRSQFYLFTDEYYKMKSNRKISVVPRNNNPNKMMKIYSEDFSFNNSPIRFRNYLALSLSEDSHQFFFIDNGFYLSTVKEMDYHFYTAKFVKTYNENNVLHEVYNLDSIKKGTSFYIMYSNDNGNLFKADTKK